MRRAFQALMPWGAAFDDSRCPAAARDYLFCIKGCDGDCSFKLPAVSGERSGRLAYRDANPYLIAEAELADRSHQFRRRF
jgi:hypothetical protein